MYKSNTELLLWCDVETEIFRTLEIISQDVNSLSGKNNKSIESSLLDVSVSNEISLLFLIYLNSHKFRGKENDDKIHLEIWGIYDALDIYDFLFKELNLFELKFSEYLTNLTNNNADYESKSHKLLNKLFGKNEEIHILNFNYTNPLQNFDTSVIHHMNNIHGRLTKKDIIFGIDSFEDLDENLFIFTKTNRIISLENEKMKPIPHKDHTFSISFFGHSFSSADYSYFLSIFDYYNIYDSDITLNFFYTNFNLYAKRDLLKNVTNLMLMYGERYKNESKRKNLMHKLALEHRLSLILIENDDTNKELNK